ALTDTGTGSGLSGDLRYCIDQANTHPEADSITFDATVFGTLQTIPLTSHTALELADTAGETDVTGPAAGVIISGDTATRVFQVDVGVTANLPGLTLANGSGVGIGAGILTRGTLTVTGCTLSDNVAGFGGGIFTEGGTLTVTSSTFSGNI